MVIIPSGTKKTAAADEYLGLKDQYEDIASKMELKERAWPRFNVPMTDMERALAKTLAKFYSDTGSTEVPPMKVLMPAFEAQQMEEYRREKEEYSRDPEAWRKKQGDPKVTEPKPKGLASYIHPGESRKYHSSSSQLLDFLIGLASRGALEMSGNPEDPASRKAMQKDPQSFFKTLPSAFIDPWSLIKNLGLSPEVLRQAADATRGNPIPEASGKVKNIINKIHDPVI